MKLSPRSLSNHPSTTAAGTCMLNPTTTTTTTVTACTNNTSKAITVIFTKTRAPVPFLPHFSLFWNTNARYHFFALPAITSAASSPSGVSLSPGQLRRHFYFVYNFTQSWQAGRQGGRRAAVSNGGTSNLILEHVYCKVRSCGLGLSQLLDDVRSRLGTLYLLLLLAVYPRCCSTSVKLAAGGLQYNTVPQDVVRVCSDAGGW